LLIRVTDVLDLYSAGLTPRQILEEFPDLQEPDLKHASNTRLIRSIIL